MERLNILCIDVFSNARVHCDIRIVRGKMYGGVIANASRRAWGNRDDETSETEDRMDLFHAFVFSNRFPRTCHEDGAGSMHRKTFSRQKFHGEGHQGKDDAPQGECKNTALHLLYQGDDVK